MSKFSDAAVPAVAFLLPPNVYEMVFGDEQHGSAIRTQANVLFSRALGPDQLKEWPEGLEKAEAVFTGWGSPCLDQALLQRMPRLKVVFHAAASFRHYMSDALWDRGIVVTTSAMPMAVPVADYTLAMILLSLKQTWALARQTRNDRTFPAVISPPGVCASSTLGLISLGRVGELVLKRLQQYDVRIIAHDPYLTADQFRSLGVESVALPELMTRSNVVSLHAPMIKETAGMITGDLLRLLPPGSTFINTARGGLVREDELVQVLRERPDLQAIIDVTMPEPPHPQSPLYDLPNVLLTPHLAGPHGPERRKLGQTMVEEFGRYRRGEALQYALSRERANRET